MSRFFQQEESEVEDVEKQEEKIEVIQKEPEAKKKKKKNKDKEKEVEQNQTNQTTGKRTKKKNKPISAIALKAQQAVEEKRQKEELLKQQQLEKLSKTLINYFEKSCQKFVQEIVSLLKSIVKKQNKIQQEKIDLQIRTEQAKKIIEEWQRLFQEQLKLSTEQGEKQEVKKHKKKKMDKYERQKIQMNQDQEITDERQEEEKMITKYVETHQHKQEVVIQQLEHQQINQEEEDDWEQLFDKNKELEQKLEQEKKNINVQENIQEQNQEKNKDQQNSQEKKIDHDFQNLFTNSSIFRSPVICVLGHVDTGKTKILDHIRNTKVQDGEEGGITQQIGASFFPSEKLKEETAKLDKKVLDINVKIPGFLIIDTPGHESFSNLRSRGSSLCDLAIVVIDIMHSIENQTKESLEMLISKNIPFVIALNKIDWLYDWEIHNDQSSYTSLKKQKPFVIQQFEEKFKSVFGDLIKMGINAKLYWDKKKDSDYVNIIPTSAITGEGMPDLLGFLAFYCQENLTENIKKNYVDFKATVMEVKKIEGLGATVDSIMINGTLKVEDKIVLSGMHGPIVTQIRALLTPHPLKELRVKNEYLSHQEIKGSVGVKICAPYLEEALTGSSIYQYQNETQLQTYIEILNKDIEKIKKNVKLKKFGVGVAASTLGSLEALLVFLKEVKIDVSTICIGDVTKNDLLKVLSPFLQEKNKSDVKQEFLTMLCFDVKILPDALQFAEMHKIKIIQAKIIYHLFDHFNDHVKKIKDAKKVQEGKLAVFPCILKQVQAFNKKDPMIIGVDVQEGVLRVGTVLCIPSKNMLEIGVVESIEKNKNQLSTVRAKDGSVAIKVVSVSGITHGKQFELSDNLYSKLTRQSIDKLKEHFREEMLKSDWDLVRNLKTIMGIE